MLGKIFHSINTNLGQILFNNPNTLYYNIFNNLHLSLIANKNIKDNEYMQKYLQDGFFKTNINSSEFCHQINSKIAKQFVDSNTSFHRFHIDDEMKEKIRNHINIKFSPILKEIEKFYNSKIAVANIKIQRNFHINEKIDKEVYSENYHADAYVYNHFKLFINLTDVTIDQGPLHIYSKKSTKKFMKVTKYKDRNNYHNSELQEQLFCNVGKIGESLIANTTECVHKAGFVKKGFKRDILFVTFITIPELDTNIENNFFYYENKYPDAIWKNGNDVVKIAKPQSLKKTIKLFFQYFKHKLN